MRIALSVSLGLVLLGCSRQAAGPTVDFDSAMDAEEARAFCVRWQALAGDASPGGALKRAQLALQAPSTQVMAESPCGTLQQIEAKAAEDAERAAKELGNSPEAWRALAAWRMQPGCDPRPAADAACRAAELDPRSAAAREVCGDALLGLGDSAGAVREWKAAFLASMDREQQFELIEKIQATSLQPATDLASLPPEVLEQYRNHRARERSGRFHSFH